MSNGNNTLKPFKHAPSVEISTWRKGILSTKLATDEETGGAFDFVLAHMKSGMEPPPHVHSREHEFFYVLEGKLEVYAGDSVYQLGPGECAFLPLGIPHTFIIRSGEVRMLALVTPGGFIKATEPLSIPAEKLEMPSDSVIYGAVDMQKTIKIFTDQGLSLLTPEEIAREMPAFLSRATV